MFETLLIGSTPRQPSTAANINSLTHQPLPAPFMGNNEFPKWKDIVNSSHKQFSLAAFIRNHLLEPIPAAFIKNRHQRPTSAAVTNSLHEQSSYASSLALNVSLTQKPASWNPLVVLNLKHLLKFREAVISTRLISCPPQQPPESALIRRHIKQHSTVPLRKTCT